ncbi:hypothetical protein [Streptomyces sp. NBC_00207]|uniref:hypothetical protein n=1 Tax=Streptomyces sp. NBC_00207 TaxID=2903635 RepID=UPI0028848C21|nr:hypothetical protein [Streptomyces sp. DSM 41633]
MSDMVKYLPEAAIPDGGVPVWRTEDAGRWRKAAVPAVFGPVFGAWALVLPVLVAFVLLAWTEPEAPIRGTVWADYPAAVLLVSLPLWYRLLPAATALAAAALAGYALFALTGLPPGDSAGRAGSWLVIALSGAAFAGALLRLRARRRQYALALAAAGDGRRELPARLPGSHRRRGLPMMLAGGGLCAAAAALLGWAAVQDLGSDPDFPYDGTGQQVLALLLLVPGIPVLGHGIGTRRAARRLDTGPQPALRVGVRGDLGPYTWLHPDVRDTSGRPLIAFRDRIENTEYDVRTLVGGAEEKLRAEHHDINHFSEPFEAVLYGAPFEGAEVVLEYAAYSGDTRITTSVLAVRLHPRRRHDLSGWTPAGRSYRVEARKNEAARREARASDSGSSGSGCGSSGSCGSDSSCGSSCGGGCGGGD